MEVFLELNGARVEASIDERESLFLDLAAGRHSRLALQNWLDTHITPSQA